MLLVAVTPSGSVAVPMSSPTSLPALSAECTQQPTSSRSGCSSTPLMAATPTPPVAHCTTRRPISSPPRSAELEHVLFRSTPLAEANGRNSMEIEGSDLFEERTGGRGRAGGDGDADPPHGLGYQRAHDHPVGQVGQPGTRQDADARVPPGRSRALPTFRALRRPRRTRRRPRRATGVNTSAQPPVERMNGSLASSA